MLWDHKRRFHLAVIGSILGGIGASAIIVHSEMMEAHDMQKPLPPSLNGSHYVVDPRTGSCFLAYAGGITAVGCNDRVYHAAQRYEETR